MSEALMTEKWIKTWPLLHQKEEGLRLYCARRLGGRGEGSERLEKVS